MTLLRKAIEVAPWWGSAYYNLARALEMRGQHDDAIEQIKYCLELNPPDGDAREARAHGRNRDRRCRRRAQTVIGESTPQTPNRDSWDAAGLG
jgi:tetratricopeptide (TPR) repeat protein